MPDYEFFRDIVIEARKKREVQAIAGNQSILRYGHDEVNDMALKEGTVNQEKAERNKAVLKKLHQSPGFIEKVQEGYAQIERGESVTVTVDDIKNKLKIVG